MPLHDRYGDVSESKYCGVETGFSNDVNSLLFSNVQCGEFDFVLMPLMDPSYRPSLMQNENGGFGTLPFAGSDLEIDISKWSTKVVGKISSWIDLDSEDDILRTDSETTLNQEIARASYLSVKECLLPTPKGTSCANYARCVHKILQGLNNLQLWLRIPLVNVDDDSADVKSDNFVDSWDLWNSFRQICEHHNQLTVALDILSPLPSPNSLGRWFGEPVRAAIISTNCFLPNSKGHPFLSKRHKKLITEFFNHSIRVVLSKHDDFRGCPNIRSKLLNMIEDVPSHPLCRHLEYVAVLYKRMEPLSEREQIEFVYRDFLQTPLQPLMNDIECKIYEGFEKDEVKYIQYQRAIVKALRVRSSSITTVLMVVGAGRGPLVRAALKAAEETKRKLKVYAVEKNPNAVVYLHKLVKMEGWKKIVTIISCDMRCWDAPEKADILVSELLGSFGDNELSPECLDGAQRFLKENGISIPSSYTNYLQPITAAALYNDAKATHKDVAYYESAYSVKLHSVARLSAPQAVFTFTHPNRIPEERSNQRYKKLVFEIPNDTGAALVHGFAGYFDATLYDDVHLGIEPSSATPNMFSWDPIFFPLRDPICVRPGSPLKLHFWRSCSPTKVWYEWCVTSPQQSPIHNYNGRTYWIGL